MEERGANFQYVTSTNMNFTLRNMAFNQESLRSYWSSNFA